MRIQIVKRTSDVQFKLHLISEDLKSRKFFRALQDMGLDDCYFQPHLDTLILQSLDMDDDTDETFDAYCEIMERRSKKIDADNDSIMRQASKAYYELLDQKRRHALKKEVNVELHNPELSNPTKKRIGKRRKDKEFENSTSDLRQQMSNSFHL